MLKKLTFQNELKNNTANYTMWGIVTENPQVILNEDEFVRQNRFGELASGPH